MDLKFTVFAHVSRPPDEVFEAVADPEQLSRYFTTGGAQGRLEAGKTVSWDFHDFPGRFPVKVIEAVPGERIVLEWGANEGTPPGEGEEPPYDTRVTMVFQPTDDDRTKVEITEEGWRPNEGALKGSYGNCMGWSQFLCALKVWLEHGINLRDGMYV